MDILSKTEVIAAIISGIFSIISIVIGIFIWRYKTKVKSKIAAEFNSQKIHLQNFFDTQIERLRVEYKTLYERRVTAIEKLYSLLIDLRKEKRLIAEHLEQYDEGNTYPKQMQGRVSELRNTLSEFKSEFTKNKIYFPTDTIHSITPFIDLIERFEEQYAFNQEEGESIEQFMLTYFDRIFPKDFESIIGGLENNFRVLMGEKQ